MDKFKIEKDTLIVESEKILNGVDTIIDTRDYVNGIGNRSREQYVCIARWPRTPCYSETDGFVELYVL